MMIKRNMAVAMSSETLMRLLMGDVVIGLVEAA
jgi:hypothetical protein